MMLFCVCAGPARGLFGVRFSGDSVWEAKLGCRMCNLVRVELVSTTGVVSVKCWR